MYSSENNKASNINQNLGKEDTSSLSVSRRQSIGEEKKRGIGTPQNIFREAREPAKIAVLELSTRACKLVIADLSKLRQGFRWDAFTNFAKITNIGQLLNEDDIIPWEPFQQQVLPEIQKKVEIAKQEKVDCLYCVATAALRKARNREQLLQNIQKELRLNVRILSGEEEARATLNAYFWKERLGQESFGGNIALIDQGGGSTELTGFSEDFQILDVDSSTNISIGTMTAMNTFFERYDAQTSLFSCLRKSAQQHREQINRATEPLQQYRFSHLIGVGSAITRATNKRGNRNQHGILLEKRKLNVQRHYLRDKLAYSFPTVGALTQFLETDVGTPTYQKVQEDLIWYFGLGMYLQVMDTLGLSKVTVNGVGLRYGICYQYIKERVPALDLGWTRSKVQEQRLDVDGLTEGKILQGEISGVHDRLGVFVQLTPDHSGLLHARYLRKNGVSMKRFYRGANIKVLITQIRFRNEKFQFSLALL